jgi:hypothetical protein
LAAIGSVMNSRQATLQGAGGPAVTIDPAQLPLPVTGRVSAAQAQLQGSTQLALSIGTGFGFQPSWTFGGTLRASNIGGINQDLLGDFDPADGTPNVTVPGGVLNGTVTLTGYLENCSITGCPAIQR